MHEAGDLHLAGVGRRVIGQTWPLQVMTASMLVAGGWWFLTTGDAMLLRAAARLELLAAVGLGVAFAIHEMAHAAALRRCSGISHVVLTATPWRFSLEPRGTMTSGQLAAVAVAGPAATAVTGLVLWAAAPRAGLHWWFLAHLVFLLPVFGDGRSLVLASRAVGRAR